MHLALQNTIAIASELSGISSVIETLSTGIDIVIVGDNDFYSQRKKVNFAVLVASMKLTGCTD